MHPEDTQKEYRTAVYWAEEARYLVDVSYPDCDRIILVMNNLNTHALSALYKTFPAREARMIAKKWRFITLSGMGAG